MSIGEDQHFQKNSKIRWVSWSLLIIDRIETSQGKGQSSVHVNTKRVSITFRHRTVKIALGNEQGHLNASDWANRLNIYFQLIKLLRQKDARQYYNKRQEPDVIHNDHSPKTS